MTHRIKGNKYRNVKTVVDGITFDSKKEAARYQELKLMERAGEIEGLELQPSYELIVNGQKVGKYIGDFRYLCEGREVVEDSKGVKTPVYNLKKKLMKAIHNVSITES